MKFSQVAVTLTALISHLSAPVIAQTFSSCNPRFTTCPADPALGRSISVDFKKGGVDSFVDVGGPAYSSDGVSLTVDTSGDSPQLASRFYIMFGKVSITMKAAPGAGIVSSLVLQSDTLDEIDFEWLGAVSTEVQSNYFGKGDVTTYNRGAFHQTPENQQEFITYDIEWTATQIIWSIGGSVARVLTPETADTNQYPQTPMQVKFGVWSGGDPANPEGTIAWARGPTNYADGPFTMIVKSISISDYSTGTSYQYNGNSGNLDDVVAIDGTIGGNQGSSATAVAEAPAVTSVSPSVPAGIGSGSQTGWPYVASTLTSAVSAQTVTIAGVPSGWVVSGNGKIVPASSAAAEPASSVPRTVSPSPSPSEPPALAAGCEVVTEWDNRGFPTTVTKPVGWQTMPKSYDQQGFLISRTCGGTPAETGAAAVVNAVRNVQVGAAQRDEETNEASPRATSVYIHCLAAAAMMCLWVML